MRKSVHHFILLEVLLAMTLVGFLGVPLIRPLIHILAEQTKMLEAIQLQRLADVTFVEVKQQLYERTIPWSELRHRQDFELTTHELSPVSLREPQEHSRHYQRSFRVYASSVSQETSTPEYGLFTIEITFTEGSRQTTFLYKLVGERS